MTIETFKKVFDGLDYEIFDTWDYEKIDEKYLVDKYFDINDFTVSGDYLAIYITI